MSDNLFDFTESSNTEETKISQISESVEITNDCFVEAIQVIRIVKGVVSKTRREILATIMIDGAKMTYERAKRVAKYKANLFGNCMVVEKMERVTSTH